MSVDRAARVAEYFDELFCRDAAITRIAAESDAEGLPSIAVSPVQGKLLSVLTRMSGARRILEVGTLGGYSAACFARALQANGEVVSLEIDAERAAVARRNLDASGLGESVSIRVGPALETLDRLIAEKIEPFDLVFIDADKRNNPRYVERALALSHQGTVVVVDNVVRDGTILDADRFDDPDVEGTRRCLEMLANDPRLEATAIPTLTSKGYDGFAIAIVRR